jgi:hypothetical protein
MVARPVPVSQPRPGGLFQLWSQTEEKILSVDWIIMQQMEWVESDTLSLGPWRSSYLLRPDLEVLARSMADYGWLQPIVVQKSTGRIIDGNIRWEVSRSSKPVIKKCNNYVPIVEIDCSDLEAAFMHIRMNRAKGVPAVKHVARSMRDLVMSGKVTQDELKKKMAMTVDEIDVMLDGTLIKHRRIDNHKYSQAWVPVEAPSAETAEFIERPPNEDR